MFVQHSTKTKTHIHTVYVHIHIHVDRRCYCNMYIPEFSQSFLNELLLCDGISVNTVGRGREGEGGRGEGEGREGGGREGGIMKHNGKEIRKRESVCERDWDERCSGMRIWVSRNGTDAISYPMFALEARMMAFITPSLCSVRNMCWEGREGREGRGG